MEKNAFTLVFFYINGFPAKFFLLETQSVGKDMDFHTTTNGD
ncbi:MAG: hypothetical protein ACYDH1_00615 [Anaerolineaceae bacterium]